MMLMSKVLACLAAMSFMPSLHEPTATSTQLSFIQTEVFGWHNAVVLLGLCRFFHLLIANHSHNCSSVRRDALALGTMMRVTDILACCAAMRSMPSPQEATTTWTQLSLRFFDLRYF